MCPSGEVCSGGSCEASCGSGLAECGGACVNLSNDPRHCAACGVVCPEVPSATPACADSRCGYLCELGFGDCNGLASDGCETSLTTELHCGACGNACGVGERCNEGLCELSCVEFAYETNSRAAGREVQGMRVVDLDGDGFEDVVTNEQLDNHLEIYWGNGTGNLASMTGQTLSLGRSGGPGAIGDIDNDGDDDILWGLQDSNTLRYIENLGGRRFAAAVSIAQAGGPRKIALVDVDGDGNLDALIDQNFGASIVLRRGRGDGTFATAQVVMPRVPFEAGDIDADGRVEVVTQSSGVVSVIELDSSGVAGPAVVLGTSPLARAAGWPELADIDDDGDLDLYLASWADGAGTLVEFINDGSGNFAPGCVVRSFEGVSGFTAALGDLNSDRRVDVVSFTTCSFCSSTIYASLAVGP